MGGLVASAISGVRLDSRRSTPASLPACAADPKTPMSRRRAGRPAHEAAASRERGRSPSDAPASTAPAARGPEGVHGGLVRGCASTASASACRAPRVHDVGELAGGRDEDGVVEEVEQPSRARRPRAGRDLAVRSCERQVAREHRRCLAEDAGTRASAPPCARGRRNSPPMFGMPRRTVSWSMTSSCTRNAVCSSSNARPTARERRSVPPNAVKDAADERGRNRLPPALSSTARSLEGTRAGGSRETRRRASERRRRTRREARRRRRRSARSVIGTGAALAPAARATG